MIVHGGLLALWLAGGWRGALVEGPSGAGKSDLALRCLEAGFRLVADDRVALWTSGGRLYGRAPQTLDGLVEVQGQGVLAASALRFAQVVLVVRAGTPERVPPPGFTERLGMRLPAIDLPLTEASAPAKLGRALTGLTALSGGVFSTARGAVGSPERDALRGNK